MSSAKAPRGRRLSAEARHVLGWCVALAVAAHLLLLAGFAPAPPRSRAAAWSAHGGMRPTRTASVRLIPPEATPFSASAAAAAPASAASAASNASSVADPAAPTRLASSPGTAGATAAAASVSASERGSEAGDETEASQGGYVPRPLLSVAPEPVVPVVIPAPPATGAGRLIGRYTGVLVLFIDEEGRVRRVEAESPTLPEPMERAAREAFLGARFSSGQVAGRAVKSRIRVEVVFDDAPASLTASASAAASSASSVSAASAGSAGTGASASAAPRTQGSP